MEKSILWLMEIEANASVVYEKAALRFSHDKGLSDLLLKLSQDERSHKDALEKALIAVAGRKDFASEIALDETTAQDILRPFIEFRNRLSDGRLSKEDLLKYVTEIEFSELNHVFLYLINSAAEIEGVSLNIARDVELHKDRILEYISSMPDGGELLKKAGKLPKTHKKKILVIDDKSPNVRLLKAVLEGEGIIYTAGSAAEALERLSSRPFAAVLTDVDMPRMSGIELYLQTVERHPEMKDRFIFYTGSSDSENISFLTANNLPYLLKPAPINSIRSTVRSILLLNNNAG